jgi:hypothetical protein
MLNAIM